MKKRSFLLITIIGLSLFLSISCQTQHEGVAEQSTFIMRRFLDDSNIKILPPSVSFLTQSHITFTGISSPSDISKIELFDSSQSVELRILKKLSDSIICYFIGGIGGDFKGRLSYLSGKTVVTVNQIEVKVKIYSISPNQGNQKGGVILTIKGENFSFTNLENQVFIDDIQCDVFQSSDKEIKCITRPQLNSQGKKSVVSIKNGLLKSISDNNLNIEYTSINIQQQPTITKIGSNQIDFIMGETVIIEGTNLFAEGQQTVLFFGEQILNYQKTLKGLSFTVPYDLMKKKYEFIIYVGQNGSTKAEEINILFEIKKLLCLNPDTQELINNNNQFFIGAYITGLKTNSVIEFQYNTLQQEGYTTIYQNQQGFLMSGYLASCESIEQILIDGNQMLSKPIKFLNSNQNIYLQFDIKTHPDNTSYFQMVLKQNQNPDIDIYEIFIICEDQNFDQMIKESKNTFKFKKYENKQSFQITYCSNQGFGQIDPKPKLMTIPQQKVIRLSYQKDIQSGDILKFRIPKPHTQQYVLWVLCTCGQFYRNINLNKFKDDEGEVINDVKDFKDIYQVYPSKQEGDKFEFKFPTILKRPKAAKKSCDLIIVRENLNTLIQKKIDQNNNLETYKENFQRELNGDDKGEYDKGEAFDIGEGYVSQHSVIQEVFLDAINPIKENIYVLNVEPNNISSYGGEQIVITGTNFLANNNKVSSTKVWLQGVECIVQAVTDSQIICISGGKMFYNILENEETIIKIGKAEAFLFKFVRYYFDFSDLVKFRFFNNEFVKSKNLYVPQQFALVLDISQVFQENDVNLGTLSIDGKLILKSSKDQTITIEKINGSGEVSIGTDMERINNKVTFQINEVSVKNFNAYGKKLEKYSYKVKQPVTPDSEEVQFDENQIFLQQESKILFLSTSLDEENEEFVVKSIDGNKIKLSDKLKYSHKNLLETHKLQNGKDYQFKIDSIALLVDRSLTINIKKMKVFNCLMRNIVDTDLNVYDNGYRIEQLINSIFRSKKKQQSQNIISINAIKKSILFVDNNLDFISGLIQDSYLLQNSLALTNSITIKSISKIINNFIQSSIQINIDFPNSTPEFSKNTIVKADTCIILNNIDYVVMNENICFSVNSILNQVQSELIISTGLAISGLDIRNSLITHIHNSDYYTMFSVINNSKQSQHVKFFIVANTKYQVDQNKPILLRILNDTPNEWRLYSQLFNFDIQGFGLANQDQLITSQNNFMTNVIEFNKFQSDITKNSLIFDPQINVPIILIDKDGSLTGIKQGLVSSKIESPKLNISLNSLNQNTISKQIGVIQLNLSTQYSNCEQKYGQLELDGIKQSEIMATSQEDISTFRFLDQSNQETVLCLFSLKLRYLQDSSKSLIIKYLVDMSQFDVQLYSWSQKIFCQRIFSNLSFQNCQHGQYFLESDGVSVCLKTFNDEIRFYMFSKGYYPYIQPNINNFQSSNVKNFVTEGDWQDGIHSTRNSKKWTILQNWNMVLSTEGEIIVPSLEILGTLTIDLKEKSAKIIAGGISISGGQIIIKSGKIVFEFIDDNSGKPIFVNFIEDKKYFSKPFLIFGKFISNINEEIKELQSFRLYSIDQANKKKITISQNSSADFFKVDDTIIIACPITSESFKAQIIQIVNPYNSSTKLITIELDQEILYTQQYLKKTYNQKDLDFRPIVSKINRQVVIKNANIYIRSYNYNVIPEVNFVGVQFIDSTIEISKKINSIFIKNSTFISVDKLQDVFVSVTDIAWEKMTTQEYQKISTKIQIFNNFFYDAKKHINISRFKNQEQYQKIGDPFQILFDYLDDLTDYDQQFLNVITLEKNILINASTISLETIPKVNMKENIIIKSTQSCLKSYFCPITSFDQLYDCGKQGIESEMCNNFSNVVVARSKLFSSATVGLYTSVISIENDKHFNFDPKSYSEQSKNKQKTLIKQSSVVFNLFQQNGSCKPQILLSSSLEQATSNYLSFSNLITEIEVFDYKCSQNAIIKLNNQNEIQPFININKSTCTGCTLSMNDLITLDSSISNIPDTFRVQDTEGNFLNPGSNKPLAYIKQNNNLLKQIQIEQPLSAIFIKQINISPDTVKSYYQFNNEKFNVISSFQNYAVAYLQSNKQYDMTADKQLNNIIIGLESFNNVKQYVILKIKLKEGFQLVIKDQLSQTILPTPFNIYSASTDLLKLAVSDISKLKCGMNVQDKDTLDNFVIITSDDDCEINLQEFQSTIIKFKIATPILPPPTPEEEGMCDADRRTAYIVQRISNLLEVEKSRVRLLGRSQGICTSRLRFLQNKESIDEYIFAIDPISSSQSIIDSPETTADSIEKKEYIKQKNNLDIIDMVDVISNINNMLLQNQVEQGFKIENIDVQIPKFDTSNLCQDGQFREQQQCVSACSSNFYASGNICFPCNEVCNGCKGSTKFDCKECKEGNIQMADNNQKNYCGKCSENCKNCLNESTCNECKQNFLMNESTCLSVCPEGKYEQGNKCEVCPSNCKTCQSKSICTSCLLGKSLDSTNQCVDNISKPTDNSDLQYI